VKGCPLRLTCQLQALLDCQSPRNLDIDEDLLVVLFASKTAKEVWKEASRFKYELTGTVTLNEMSQKIQSLKVFDFPGGIYLG